MELFADPAWHARLHESLAGDALWTSAARWFDGSLALRHEDGVVRLDIRDGELRVTAEPTPHGDVLALEAPDATWRALIEDVLDIVVGIGTGQVTLRGDQVFATHHMRLLYAAVEGVRRTAGVTGRTAPSPAPGMPPADIRGAYLHVDSIRTYYEEAGSGIPLVCLHAAGQDTLMYRHVLDGLSDRFRVITLDAPGRGKTLQPPGGPFTSITQHAEFNERFIDALQLNEPVLIGCSMAGNMVLEMGARRPSAYSAIVSCEGAAHTPTLDEFTLDMVEQNGANLAEVYGRSLTGRRTPEDRASEVVWQLCRTTPAVMRADLTGYRNFDQRAALPAITAPVLLLRGRDDWLVSQEMVDDTAAGIADSRIVVLEGTGHYPMIENPVEFNHAVDEFLAEVLRSRVRLDGSFA